jgi:aryl-alcohol dehydrogenase-like predicted oxidoreductase
MEYSVGCREIENDVLPSARALGVSVVAYAPLARGLLAGIKPRDLHPLDWRQSVRFPYRRTVANVQMCYQPSGASAR